MNKRLKFLISVSLIFALFVSVFVLPAASYQNDVETSTADMLLVNMDTDTVVFSQKPDNMWYAGYLSELMTFVIADEMIDDPDAQTVKVDKAYIGKLPYTDGCLERFLGIELTAHDLMAIMLLSSGSDAAYVLADMASGGDIPAFVDKMNDKAAELGCTNTGYVSPGYNNTSDQYTTGRDLYKLYQEVLTIDFFHQVMEAGSYTPVNAPDEEESTVAATQAPAFGESVDEEVGYTVQPQASIIKPNSPYYFRYVNDAKYSYTEETYASLVLTTTYRGSTYFYAGLLGLNESERNVFADARKLTTWAYLNLSDRKLINEEDIVSEINVQTEWGDYPVSLHPSNSAFKTLPNDYDADKLSYTLDVPESVNTPVKGGQSVGKAKVTYDGEEIDDISLSIPTDEGLDPVSDFGRFCGYTVRQLTPNEPSDEDYDNSDEAATKDTKSKSGSITLETTVKE